jgi:hypothetical protein
VEILFTLGALLFALIAAAWSSARSYFAIGRLRGIEEATRELVRGACQHYELEGQVIPERVAKALDHLKSIADRPRKVRRGTTDPLHAHLWVIGDAIGEASWLKGHSAGLRRKAPAEGKIRVDFSINELLQLSWLAHFGFQHMMPNFRGFGIHRFSGHDDAEEGAIAVAKIERAIPANSRPFADLSEQLKYRQKLISDWWQRTPDRQSA